MKKTVSGILFVLLLVCVFTGTFNVQSAKAKTSSQGETVRATDTDWWSMFHHDLSHTGYSTSTAPNTNQTLWNYTTGALVYSSPAVVNAVVYVGSYDGKIYAFGPPPLTVSISPTSVTADVGQSNLFTSTVSGGTSPYTYQWYLNSAPVLGATSPTWTFTPTSVGSCTVCVTVTDSSSMQATSNNANVTVSARAIHGTTVFLSPYRVQGTKGQVVTVNLNVNDITDFLAGQAGLIWINTTAVGCVGIALGSFMTPLKNAVLFPGSIDNTTGSAIFGVWILGRSKR